MVPESLETSRAIHNLVEQHRFQVGDTKDIAATPNELIDELLTSDT